MTLASGLGPTVVLVPVKAFADAKVRLAPALDAGARAELARTMAAQVVAAAAPLPVAVVCDDAEVAAWARSLGARVLDEPGRGLNGAVQQAVAQLGAEGVTQVLVAHADLPLARELAWLTAFDGVTLVPDRHQDGTNVICVPVDAGFRFAYGPGSFARHLAEAERLPVAHRVVHVAQLAWDVDVPADLLTAAPE
ncbi:MAG TPA: 2-phospho-L-lactate guanylyltransferase [Acidimicrobiales bacterium]|nr:2-phospho-L-lactate guanylyltransferase [Acidimicrobiales bacterium]